MLPTSVGPQGCWAFRSVPVALCQAAVSQVPRRGAVGHFSPPATYNGRWCQLHLYILLSVCACSSLCSQSPAPLSTIPLVSWHLGVTSHLSIVQLTGSDSLSLLQVEMTTSFLTSFGGLQGISPSSVVSPISQTQPSLMALLYPPPTKKKELGNVHSVGLCLGGGKERQETFYLSPVGDSATDAPRPYLWQTLDHTLSMS